MGGCQGKAGEQDLVESNIYPAPAMSDHSEEQDDHYQEYGQYPVTSSPEVNSESELGELGEPHRVHWDDDEESLPDFGDEMYSTYTGRSTSARTVSARPGTRTRLSDLDEDENETEKLPMAEGPQITNRAPSLSFWYDDNTAGDILTTDVYVPANGLAKETYYCCLQWNSGKNGGGYCGIQDHKLGRNYIFSIWDPVDSDKKIRPVFIGPGTVCEKFGGEGTGLKSWNFELGWDVDNWYTFVTRRWDQEEHTFYGLWVKHQIENEWTHIVTLDFPVEDIWYDTWTCSFLEDWQGTGQNERKVHLKNGYKRSFEGKWIPFDKAVFGVVKEESSKQYENNYDAGAFDDTFYLKSGGKTVPAEDLVEGKQFGNELESKPDTAPISCYLTNVTEEEIEWNISSGSVPQFQYIVLVDKEIYKQEVSSECRICTFDTPPKAHVELMVEDIYGRTVRSKFSVKDGLECKPELREARI